MTPTPVPNPTSTPKPTPTLTLTATATTVESGGYVTLTGTLSLPKSGTVDLTYSIGSSGFTYHRSRTMTNGEFNDTFGFLDLTTWQFKAIWPGDETSNSSESNVVTITVVKANPTLTLSTNSTTANVGQSIMLTGYLSIMRNGTITLDWAIGSSGFIYQSNEIMTDHVFTRSFGFSQAGTWQLRINWLGDSTSNSATSNIITVTVNP